MAFLLDGIVRMSNHVAFTGQKLSTYQDPVTSQKLFLKWKYWQQRGAQSYFRLQASVLYLHYWSFPQSPYQPLCLLPPGTSNTIESTASQDSSVSLHCNLNLPLQFIFLGPTDCLVLILVNMSEQQSKYGAHCLQNPNRSSKHCFFLCGGWQKAQLASDHWMFKNLHL